MGEKLMISIEKYKEALGDEAAKLSEEEILKLRENHDKLSDVLFNTWLDTLKQEK